MRRPTMLLLVAAVMVSCVQGFQPRLMTKTSTRMMMATEISPIVTTPPATFLKCVEQAVTASKKSLANGDKLLEVEFPPLPLEVLEDSASSARDIADANTRWAVEYAKSFTEILEGQVTILYPDDPELRDAIRYVYDGQEGSDEPFPGVKLATHRTDSIRNAGSIDQVLMSIFGATFAGTVEAIPNTKMYVALISSTQELPQLEKLHAIDPSIPMVLFNLRLDILRGDLGLPLFPTRDLQFRFLSKIRPVYQVRSRSFSTSLRRPPYIVNYSGLLFRCYPEPFQAILNTGDGKNKLVKTFKEKPTNMGFRVALTDALRIPGVPQAELSAPGNLVWWEKEVDKEQSPNWRL